MKNYLTFSFLFAILKCFSQKDTSFFDKDWKPCQRQSAEYYRIIQPEGGSFIVTDYYINNNIQMEAVCSRIDTLIKNGKATFYNKQGLLTDKGVFMNNVESGTWIFIEYTKNDKKYNSGFYQNNLLDSILTSYYPSGNIYSTSTFKNDTLNGLQTNFREDGSVYSTAFYLSGKRNGWYVEYRKNEIKKYEEEYKNGKTTGSRRLYFENGQIQGDFLWAKRRVDGHKIWYYKNGGIQSKVIFINGRRKKIIRAGKLLG